MMIIAWTIVCVITAEKGEVARDKGEGEKEKECTAESEVGKVCKQSP